MNPLQRLREAMTRNQMPPDPGVDPYAEEQMQQPPQMPPQMPEENVVGAIGDVAPTPIDADPSIALETPPPVVQQEFPHMKAYEEHTAEGPPEYNPSLGRKILGGAIGAGAGYLNPRDIQGAVRLGGGAISGGYDREMSEYGARNKQLGEVAALEDRTSRTDAMMQRQDQQIVLRLNDQRLKLADHSRKVKADLDRATNADEKTRLTEELNEIRREKMELDETYRTKSLELREKGIDQSGARTDAYVEDVEGRGRARAQLAKDRSTQTPKENEQYFAEKSAVQQVLQDAAPEEVERFKEYVDDEDGIVAPDGDWSDSERMDYDRFIKLVRRQTSTRLGTPNEEDINLDEGSEWWEEELDTGEDDEALYEDDDFLVR